LDANGIETWRWRESENLWVLRFAAVDCSACPIALDLTVSNIIRVSNGYYDTVTQR